MSIVDPKIIAMQLWHSFQKDAPEAVFDRLAQQIISTQRYRETSAVIQLITFARIATELWHDAKFLDMRLREIYACEHRDDPQLTQIVRNALSDFPPSRETTEDELSSIQTLISLPLGTQKARARLKRSQTTERLLRSPEPSVIEILCQNPSVLERDILYVAAKRPTTNACLEAVLASPWAKQRNQRFALAANPYLSISHAMRVSLTLPKQDLIELTKRPDIHQILKKHADALLKLNEIPAKSKNT